MAGGGPGDPTLGIERLPETPVIESVRDAVERCKEWEEREAGRGIVSGDTGSAGTRPEVEEGRDDIRGYPRGDAAALVTLATVGGIPGHESGDRTHSDDPAGLA